MPRILVLCTTLPYPPIDGTRLRQLNTARIINDRHTIDLLAITNDKPAKDRLSDLRSKFNAVYTFPHRDITFLWNSIRSFGSGEPFQKARFVFSDVHRWINAHKDDYDLLYCNSIQTAAYGINVGIPRVIDLIDAISRNYDSLGHASGFPMKYLYPIEASRLRAYEREVAEEFDRTIVISEADRDYIIEGNSLQISVVPNGVRPELLSFEPSALMNGVVNGKVISFLGSMDILHNIDAAKYFVTDIFPRIRSDFPDISFFIIGKTPPKEIKRLGRLDGVTVTGYVNEPAEYLVRSNVVVAPMRFGTGLQNKIIEAMALGKPVITTELGREGIDARPGKHILVANDETEFAQMTSRVINDTAFAERIGSNAREAIEQSHTWEAIAQNLLNVVNGALGPL